MTAQSAFIKVLRNKDMQMHFILIPYHKRSSSAYTLQWLASAGPIETSVTSSSGNIDKLPEELTRVYKY